MLIINLETILGFGFVALCAFAGWYNNRAPRPKPRSDRMAVGE